MVKTIHAEPGKYSQLVPFMEEERGNMRKGGREEGCAGFYSENPGKQKQVIVFQWGRTEAVHGLAVNPARQNAFVTAPGSHV